MAYPSVYPLAHSNLVTQPLFGNRPSHSIHVGAPDVNIDVHTTREHVAHNPEKQVWDTLVAAVLLFVLFVCYLFLYHTSHSLRSS